MPRTRAASSPCAVGCVCQTARRSEPETLKPFARRLSLRIWLTVVVGMAVLTLAGLGLARGGGGKQPEPAYRARARWRCAAPMAKPRLCTARAGARARANFRIQTDTGENSPWSWAPSPRAKTVGRAPERRGHGMQPPGGPPGGGPERSVAFGCAALGFVWMLGIMGVAVALGCTPSSGG